MEYIIITPSDKKNVLYRMGRRTYPTFADAKLAAIKSLKNRYAKTGNMGDVQIRKYSLYYHKQGIETYGLAGWVVMKSRNEFIYEKYGKYDRPIRLIEDSGKPVKVKKIPAPFGL